VYDLVNTAESNDPRTLIEQI